MWVQLEWTGVTLPGCVALGNDEGITPLHNAVCAGHHHIVRFLLDFGVNVNAADSDGW